MSDSALPERPSLEYLKKLAKDRLDTMRRTDPAARLSMALLAVARDHGFSSWRALKAEVARRQTVNASAFVAACAGGDVEALRRLLVQQPALARASNPDAPHAGWTGLHEAAKGGHADVVRLLLAHGADVNAREAGDNTSPLHWAAAGNHHETVRALLDGGADVHGTGDVHELDVIGWAAFYHAPGVDPADIEPSRRDLVALLVQRGARHHIFSALSVGDHDLIRSLVEHDPDALDRRLSRFERGQTPLHLAMNRKRYDLVDLLIELGADVDAPDGAGQTPLAVAMLRGDREAMTRLHAAGAAEPPAMSAATMTDTMERLAASVSKGVAMIYVPDVAQALDWYASIGFKEIARYADDGVVNFGMVSYGGAEVMFNLYGKPAPQGVSLWFYTDQVDGLYQVLKARQLDAVKAALAGDAGARPGIAFEQDIEDMFYGARQFCIRDPNGCQLYFIQSIGG
jgi:ankyrin repeat protein